MIIAIFVKEIRMGSEQIKTRLRERILVMDGAMGTMIQEKSSRQKTSAARTWKGVTKTSI